MSDNFCVAYEIAKSGFCARKIGAYHGGVIGDRDAAMCSALVNRDKNHFYFSCPDLVPQAGCNLEESSKEYIPKFTQRRFAVL